MTYYDLHYLYAKKHTYKKTRAKFARDSGFSKILIGSLIANSKANNNKKDIWTHIFQSEQLLSRLLGLGTHITQ